jgi:uncharacterized protein with NAD-binding domain and iron-sulfur cluster
MAKTKVAILGGGVAGLTTAYNLSKTPALREQYCVTVYQMGWRLGGKAASGRDARGRNLEHGLHVWFGCYENTFQLLQQIYAARTPPPDSPFQRWTDVVKPQDFTPIGVQTAGNWGYVPVTWPTNSGVPGNGRLTLSPWEIITEVISLVKILLDRLQDAKLAATQVNPPEGLLDRFGHAILAGLHPDSDGLGQGQTLAAQSTHTMSQIGTAASLWATALGRDPLRFGASHPTGIADLLRLATDALAVLDTAAVSPAICLMLEAVDIFGACLRGAVNDLILPDRPLESLDDMDFRAWLLKHGARPDVVAHSSVARLIYDTAFQYIDGDTDRPSIAAGCALGCCMRLVGTYQGAMMWELQGGMGEAVVAPLYEALTAAGVKFRFFHKVISLELTGDGSAVAKVTLDRQADTVDGEYSPTFPVGGLTCWPAEPLWKQLRDGAALQAKCVNFESHWCDEPPVGTLDLVAGTDFDTVVLAISLGAYKKLNGEPSICQALIDRRGPFAAFVENIGIVPTLALQLWCDVPTAQLGWGQDKAATVSGPELLNIWADMTQVLVTETPPPDEHPRSLHYLCGTYPTTLYRAPAARTGTPAQASAEVKALAIDWLQHRSYGLWPAACDRQDFAWQMLTDPQNRAGAARLDAQFLRANIDPTECCVASAAGTTQFRLPPDGSGFTNLVLAGEGTRHGFNASSIEGAVMSGMAAAQTISGVRVDIVGYDFMRLKPSEFLI